MGKTATKDKADAVDGEEKPRYGRCADCDNPVDVVVDIYQLTEPCRWICPECRAQRIRNKAEGEAAAIRRKGDKAAETLIEEANETREALVQGNLFDEQEPSEEE